VVNIVKTSSITKYRLFISAWLTALCLVLMSSAQAAVEAQLDRNRIVAGETVTLTIRTDNAKQSLDADLSAIEKDFQILDRRSETQLSIADGRQTAVVRLLLTLEPRRSGDLLIPALNFGNADTRPLLLRVDPAPELEPGELPPVFIEVEITPRDGPFFVHAQFGLIVRVFYQQNLTEAAISQPEPSPASVRLLQETPFQAERGGVRFRVLERNYAIFPERSGKLIIPAMQLSGRLVERRSSGVWQPTVRGRRVKVESEVLKLHIEPKPAGFTGADWQPARELVLTQQISSADALRVGEPVTRTVIVDAVGLEENMLAEPAWPELPDARIYPDQPQGITRDDGQWVLGHKEFRYAVVPEIEGELVLPELTIDWWDTTNSRKQTAVLPSHTLFVQPSMLVPPPATTAAAQGPAPALAAGASRETVSVGEPAYWRWLALLFAVLWLITMAAAWRIKGSSRSSDLIPREPSGIAEDEAGILDNLKKACEKDDRRKARRAMQAWLREFGPAGDGSLFEFAAGLGGGALRESVYAMDSDGFRQDSELSWSGKTFWKQFETWRRKKQGADKLRQPPLTDLYARKRRNC